MTKFIRIREDMSNYYINIDDISYFSEINKNTRVFMKTPHDDGSRVFFDLNERFDDFCKRLYENITD